MVPWDEVVVTKGPGRVVKMRGGWTFPYVRVVMLVIEE